MQQCMKTEISPANEFKTNNSTGNFIVDEQLCAGDAYFPINASDNVLDKTHNPNFMEGYGNYSDIFVDSCAGTSLRKLALSPSQYQYVSWQWWMLSLR